MVVGHIAKEVTIFCNRIEYPSLSCLPIVFDSVTIYTTLHMIDGPISVWERKIDICDRTKIELFVCAEINSSTDSGLAKLIEVIRIHRL
jgi:hypothetical protein